MAAVNPIPEGLRTLTAQLTVDDAAAAIELYKKCFGAEERSRAPDPSGKKVWHSELRIGDSVLFVNDAFPDQGGHAHPSELWLYSDKADDVFNRCAAAGMSVVMPMADMFWGDRTGTLKDRFGNRWTIGKHIKNMTAEEQKKAADEFIRKMKH